LNFAHYVSRCGAAQEVSGFSPQEFTTFNKKLRQVDGF
jgi:hypothetical protein